MRPRYLALICDDRATTEDRVEAVYALRVNRIARLNMRARDALWRVVLSRHEPASLRAETMESIVCFERRRSLAARRFASLIRDESEPEVVFWAAYGFSCYGRIRECGAIRKRLLEVSTTLDWKPFPGFPDWDLRREFRWALTMISFPKGVPSDAFPADDWFGGAKWSSLSGSGPPAVRGLAD